jgi:hypothetical protein
MLKKVDQKSAQIRELFNWREMLSIDWENSFFKKTWGSMRTAVIASSAAIMFGIAILMMSLFAVTSPMAVFPQEATVTATQSSQPKVEYYLPYPGVLPDSPLYKLKAIRDRVSLWLTRNPAQRERKELMLADKRINAALALMDGGKRTLAVSTATKAEKYIEESARRTIGLSRQGTDVKSDLSILIKATAKHQEILQGIINKLSGNEREVLDKSMATTKHWQEQVQQMLLESK